MARPAMPPRLRSVSAITLGVEDLERSLRFYRDGLGLPTKGIVGREFENGAVVFLDLQGALKLALFERKNLALDAGLPPGPRSSTEFALAHNVAAREDVDILLDQATRAGAKVVKGAHDTFWGGYAAYFLDPDEHLWEIAWNPHWPLAASAGEAAGSDEKTDITWL